ncbi:ABC transporter substrate-binding protein [Clostridium estertheticum]|uniref:ABC transporter substrate-binding protein n=1 Tax=Clostridium estertheticum TaxID=238834 RepID=UPI001C7DF92E|nr:ABC transporter substrate-binding protein [Clostridium estertheticum]MBX4261365.1 ABC transporter substrate-binding protein [Clostridium estertheticum]WLC70664.1 ABC transporter substrate-binding protein [Clostridium estertheticum]
MKQKFFLIGLVIVICVGLIVFNNSKKDSQKTVTESASTSNIKQDTQTITYLNKKYKLPKNVTKIVTASLESMEDAAVLGVKPIGAITVGGKLPQYLASKLDGAVSIGEKMQPNYETLLKLKPDVIMWSSKSPGTVTEKLGKVAPTIPYSHISTNWDSNLRLMASLTGKQPQAEKIITEYKLSATKTKLELGNKLKDKKVIIARIRGGSIYLYPSTVYFNPVIYNDLGLTVPEEIKPIKAQEMISLEKFSEMNPDYIFLQFAGSENSEKTKALDELEKNPIWKSITAVKNKNVFVNSVDPLLQGGTAMSKTSFLEVVKSDLVK